MWIPASLSRSLYLPGPLQYRRTRSYRPNGLDDLESRTLLSHQSPGGGALVNLIQGLALGGHRNSRLPSSASPGQGQFVLVPPEYYPQAIPTPDRSGIISTNPIWNNAKVYQYGPYPDQRLWILVPPYPNGKLDLIVHSGGLLHGDPTSGEIDGFAQFDLDQGTTVVSIGYRKLDAWVWPATVDDIAKGIDDGVQVAQDLTGHRIFDITETGLSAGGTALVLINYSNDYPTTMVRPNRIITISAPLEANAVSPARPAGGFRYPTR